jgi:hypothetical protein
MGRPLSNVSLKTNLLVILATFVVGDFFALLQLPPAGSGGVAAMTTRGDRMFVVRYPKPPTGPQRQIEVSDVTTGSHPRLAMLANVDARDGATDSSVELTLDQWQAIDGLRQQWCADSPHFPSAASAAPVYDIGLCCEYSNHGMPRSIYVRTPGDALPISVQRLIELFPQSMP